MALLRTSASSQQTSSSSSSATSNLKEFARYVPLRLSPRERALLSVLESTLNVSEYTDNVDVALRRGNKSRRILDGILEACNIATGLAVAGGQDAAHYCEEEDDCDDDNNNNNQEDAPASKGGSGGMSLAKKKALKQQQKALKKMRKKKSKKLAASSKTALSSASSSLLKGHSEALSTATAMNGHSPSYDDLNDTDRKASVTTDTSTASTGSSSSSSRPPQLRTSSTMPTETPKTAPVSLASRPANENAKFFQTLFEIGRRNKVLNPSKMRSTYGKLMHLLQDAQSPTVAKSLGFTLHCDLVMVGSFLAKFHCQHILDDERLVQATAFVPERDEVTNQKYERHFVEDKVRRKRELVEELIRDYAKKKSNDSSGSLSLSSSSSAGAGAGSGTAARSTISEEDLRRCIESIADAVAVVETNLAPVKRMLRLLEENFDPSQPDEEFSLELRGCRTGFSSYSSSSGSYGRFGFSAFGSTGYGGGSSGGGGGGATLNHHHSTQYTFVWQSLRLWCKVQQNMHRLWVCADEDLLSTTTSYQLWNTGQGLNRVQSCPRVGKVMRTLLHETQKEAGSSWVGLSVIHLGDRDVPNALVFIDKYTQIPRFLKPIVDFVDGIHDLCENETTHIASYVKREFGSVRNLQMLVLSDYFKHGFDGSGDDGGSCIDGRLTSSWNWTSRIAKKRYYHAFMLSGFQGFDGDFK